MKKNRNERIIDNVAFSMKVEGFEVTDQQKKDWRAVLEGKTDYKDLEAKYIAKARAYGQKAKLQENG